MHRDTHCYGANTTSMKYQFYSPLDKQNYWRYAAIRVDHLILRGAMLFQCTQVLFPRALRVCDYFRHASQTNLISCYLHSVCANIFFLPIWETNHFLTKITARVLNGLPLSWRACYPVLQYWAEITHLLPATFFWLGLISTQLSLVITFYTRPRTSAAPSVVRSVFWII